jgi:hypothetical protein
MRAPTPSPLALLLVVAATTGCPDETSTSGGGGDGAGPPSCTDPIFGDPTADPEIEAFFLDVNEADVFITDGATLDVVEPPQGGRVTFVGARVKNMSPCGMFITAEIKDPISGAVRFDGRNPKMVDDGQGFLTIQSGEIGNYSNIPLCPNNWAESDVFSGEWDLTVTMRAGDREAKKTYKVGLQCTDKTLADNGLNPPPGVVLDACLCSCSEGYILGDTCEGGGGAGGGGAGGMSSGGGGS